MSLADRLATDTVDQAVRRARPSHPKGWEPHVQEHGDRAVAVSQPTADPDPDERTLVEGWGFDPDVWRIDGPINCRRWQANLGRPSSGADAEIVWLYYYKANLVRYDIEGPDDDWPDLLKVASRARPRNRAAQPDVPDPATLVVALADWQAGKAAGGGAQLLVDRVQQLRVQVEQRWKTLVRDGIPLERVALLCLGDLVEACDGHYPMQPFDVQLDGRQQTKLVRRLLYGLVDTAAKISPQVLLAAVPGNHGEKRRDGKAYTSWGDNLDVEIPEQVADICASNPGRFGHVQVALPDTDDLTLTLDLSGTAVGMAHGHQFRRGGGAIAVKVDRWWAQKAKHRHLVGDADLLLSGHYHHLQVHSEGTHDGGSRTWIQCPALDGGSPWWEHTGGAPTAAGTLTFVTAAGGWSRLQIIR